METMQKTKKRTDHINEITPILEYLYSFFEEAQYTVGASKELNKLNISNELIQQLKEALKNPLQVSFDNFLLQEKVLYSFLKSIINEYFTKNTTLIGNVYFYLNQPTLLHYSIILKENTTSNRFVFNKLMNDFNNTEIGKRIELIFTFIPKEISKEAISEEFSITDKYEKLI